MPYSIVVPFGADGVISHQLGNGQEFTLEALTVLLTANQSNLEGTIMLDCRSPTGGIIYRQALQTTARAPTFYSLTPNAEPMWIIPGTEDIGSPQQFNGQEALYTERFTPVTLIAGCTIHMISTDDNWQPDLDPLAYPDLFAAWADLHLWVEDTVESKLRQLPPPTFDDPPPLLTNINT